MDSYLLMHYSGLTALGALLSLGVLCSVMFTFSCWVVSGVIKNLCMSETRAVVVLKYCLLFFPFFFQLIRDHAISDGSLIKSNGVHHKQVCLKGITNYIYCV